VSAVDALLEVQDHDLAADRLRHRRAALAEREEIEALRPRRAELAETLAARAEEQARLRRDLARLEGEAEALTRRIGEVEAAMYSGTVTSPRELQAMQADVEQLTRQRRVVEDRELVLMERLEELDAETGALGSELAGLDERLAGAEQRLAAAEAEIDAELDRVGRARDEAAAAVPGELLAVYERCRARSSSGVGIARLVGATCQGCHLTIPATEAARVRDAAARDGAAVVHCDNCGAILVAG
jgi:predicted  nucleic acid-binding Zn-ribbon protein